MQGFTRNLKPLEVLDENQIDEIERGVFYTLEKVGLKFDFKRLEALKIFKEGGCDVDFKTKKKADILAMSALMTTTAPEQRVTIKKLKEEGIRKDVIVLVGGSAITQDFADSIKADGYAPTAPEASSLAMELIKRRSE